MLEKVNNFFGHMGNHFIDKIYESIQNDALKQMLILRSGGDQYGISAEVWKAVNAILGTTKTIGIALVTTFFLMYMFDLASKEQITIESLIKALIQLIISVTLISNLEMIINTILSIGDYLLSSFVSNLNDPNMESHKSGAELIDSWLADGKDTGVTIWIQCILIWLISKIAMVACYFAIISRTFELGWRVAFAPIAVSNCFEGGMNSPAIKYLKSIAGVAISGVAMLLIMTIGFNVALKLLIANESEGPGGLLLGAAAMLATAGATIGIGAKVKEVFI